MSKFVHLVVDLTDTALGMTWEFERTYQFSSTDYPVTNIPDLKKQFEREVMAGIAHHLGFFGRTFEVGALRESIESRAPSLDEMRRDPWGERLRMVVKDGEVRDVAPIPLQRVRFKDEVSS